MSKHRKLAAMQTTAHLQGCACSLTCPCRRRGSTARSRAQSVWPRTVSAHPLHRTTPVNHSLSAVRSMLEEEEDGSKEDGERRLVRRRGETKSVPPAKVFASLAQMKSRHIHLMCMSRKQPSLWSISFLISACCIHTSLSGWRRTEKIKSADHLY